MGWVERRWAQALSVALHAGVVAVLVARNGPPAPAPAVVRVELDMGQPILEPMAEAPPPAPEPAPAAAEPPPPDASPPVPEPAAEMPPPTPEPEPVVVEPPPPALPPLPDVPPPAPEPVIALVPPPPAKPRSPETAKRLARAPVAPPVPVHEPSSQPVAPPAPAPPRSAGPPADYLARIQARLARHKVYPRAAQIAREEGTVLLRFVIARDGAVVFWTIERSSGYESLDRQVGIMVESAAPLPPLPDGVSADRLEIVLPVRFALR